MTYRIRGSTLELVVGSTGRTLQIGENWSFERWVAVYFYEDTTPKSGFGAYVANFLGSSNIYEL